MVVGGARGGGGGELSIHGLWSLAVVFFLLLLFVFFTFCYLDHCFGLFTVITVSVLFCYLDHCLIIICYYYCFFIVVFCKKLCTN